MKRIAVYLDDSVADEIHAKAIDKNLTDSKYAYQLIQLGLKIESMRQDESQKKKDEFEEKIPEYLLRLISICSETFRCVYDNEKLLTPAKNPEDSLNTIKSKVIAYMDGVTGKEIN